MFHMGWFLGAGFALQAWKEPWSGSIAQNWMDPDIYIDLAASLERACFDYLMIEDSLMITDTYRGTMEYVLANGASAPKYDPMPLIPLIARATKHIGVVGTMASTFYQPFTAARLGATLDQLTKGRVGLNIVTGSSHRSAQNYGLERQYEHSKRYEMAHEWMEVVTRLWSSWEPDAVRADRDNMLFVDHTKVHTIDFEGEYYSCRGPLNTVPGPQGRPVICQAGASGPGRAFGARWSDSIIGTANGIPQMKKYKADISQHMAEQGRMPGSCKVMFLINPVIAETDEEAVAKDQRQRAAADADIDARLGLMSYFSGIDMSKFNLDEPLPDDIDRQINGHKSSMQSYLASGKTLREIMKFSVLESVDLVGSPDTVAAKMGEVMQEVGGDGYLIGNRVTRRTIAEISDGLAPALKKRGLIRNGYDHKLFRDNLLAF